MRTFSQLRAFCSHPELLRKPSKRRDDAAALGTMFHKYVEAWRLCIAEGKPWHVDGAPEPVAGWLKRMREVWTPPPNAEVEVAMGLAPTLGGEPDYVPVDEVAPHVYVPSSMQIRPSDWAEASEKQRQDLLASCGLLTAGRADLIAPLGDGILSVDDLKSGKFYLGPPNRLRQLLAQGIAATLRADARGFVPGIYYARLGMWDRGDEAPIFRGTPEWDEAWHAVRDSALMPSTPKPGPYCLDCWDAKACVANPAVEAA
jgi:hypothetical protein